MKHHSNHSLFWFDELFRSSGYWIDCEVLRYMSLMCRRSYADIRNKDQPVAGHGFMVAGFVQFCDLSDWLLQDHAGVDSQPVLVLPSLP